ncbi:MAG: recF [Acidimicrobiaceae bacterium]|nr:recF [Acidimicrobiaceae bacterium]
MQGELRPVSGGLTVVTGDNGAGKTSLLEAIGYCSSLKSFRGSPRESLVRSGSASAIVRLEAADGSRHTLVEIEITPPRRDQAMRNRQRVRRVQELLETVRVTVFTPDDLALVKGGPQERRDFLDEVVVSAHPRLSVARHTVERVLRQRNVLLRQAGGRAGPEVSTTLDVWDHQLAAAGTELAEARATLVAELAPLASSAFSRLTGTGAGVVLDYQRSFGDSLAEALASHRHEDLKRGVTTVGPHRDDLAITSDDLDARTRLSQGRQRCVTLALRLAAHGVVGSYAGAPPVLLLDDAFSELDDATAKALVSELPPGQAILTTAGPLPPGSSPDAVVRLRDGRILP